MELIGKLLDFVAKYFWAVLVVAGFVLFIPDDAAEQLGLNSIRSEYKGVWWIVFVFSGAMWAGAIFRYFEVKISPLIATRIDERRTEKKRQENLKRIFQRLYSLDEGELMWIRYCLFHNCQSLAAIATKRIPQSLVSKGILQQGRGSIMDLPFHFPDDIWRYIHDHREDFVPEDDADMINLKPQFRSFRKHLYS